MIALGPAGRTTSRLGFGCSNLMDAQGRAGAMKVLETAFDTGIRHFDVAPTYGLGACESCLGSFIARHRQNITVTTKHGLSVVGKHSVFGRGRRLAGSALRRFKLIPFEWRTRAAIPRNPSSLFTVEQAKASLVASLRRLRTDHIDIWLLHEVTAAELEDERLLRFLEDLVRSGTIGTFGVGSEGEKIPELISRRQAYCRVVQYEWSVVNNEIPATPWFRIHHRALTNNFQHLKRRLSANSVRCSRWSEFVGEDLSNTRILAKLMLKASLVMNPDSIVLFSSNQPGHIEDNVSVAGDDAFGSAARRLFQVMREKSNCQSG